MLMLLIWLFGALILLNLAFGLLQLVFYTCGAIIEALQDAWYDHPKGFVICTGIISLLLSSVLLALVLAQ